MLKIYSITLSKKKYLIIGYEGEYSREFFVGEKITILILDTEIYIKTNTINKWNYLKYADYNFIREEVESILIFDIDKTEDITNLLNKYAIECGAKKVKEITLEY